MSREGKWHYRDNVRRMPRLRNCEPYDANPVVAWFSGLYRCPLDLGRKHFAAAANLSRRSAILFLVFDPATGGWRGSDTP